MLRRLGWTLVAVFAGGCDHLPTDTSPSDTTACSADKPAFAEVVGRALVEERTAPPATVEEDAASAIISTFQLRWAVRKFGAREPGQAEESCFVDAWANAGTVRRLVIHCDDQILYDSEATLGYGAAVTAATLIEFPEAPPDSPPSGTSTGYYGGYYGGYAPPPAPEPTKFRYHLAVDRIEDEGVVVALSTEEGWLSFRRRGLLKGSERRWTFRGEQLERRGEPVLLPAEFEPRRTSMYVSSTAAIEEPAVAQDARCKVSASIVSTTSHGEATCKVTLSCGKSSAPQTLVEDVEGPCALTDTGTVATLDLVHSDETARLTADFEARTAAFSPAPGAAAVTMEQAGQIGIAECDEYLDKYTRCIEEKMPEAAREMTLKAIQTTADAWKKAAEGPGADSLAQTCQAATETARRATAAMGCEW